MPLSSRSIRDFLTRPRRKRGIIQLCQVHRACLKGQEVVVKVQRPGLKDLFDIDLKNLREIDYTKEAANDELFASNFRNMEYVKVPSIYWEYTTPQVSKHGNRPKTAPSTTSRPKTWQPSLNSISEATI